MLRPLTRGKGEPRVRHSARAGTGLLLVAAVIAVATLASLRGSTDPALEPGTTVMPSGASASPGVAGVTRSQAIELAGRSAGEAAFAAAAEGPFSTVYEDTGTVSVPGSRLRQKRYVWAVAFELSVDICPPDGSGCTTQTGTRTIILDSATGEYLASLTVAQAP